MWQAKLALKYIKHWLNAHNTRGFGIHSPFIFHLVTEIIHDYTPFYCYAAIEKQRQLLLRNKNSIKVTDLGYGSTILKKNEKRICDIAKYSLKPKKQAQLLFRLINYMGYTNIIELGTSLGITTSYMAAVSSKSKVITLEGCPEISTIARSTFQNIELKNIELITGNFVQTLEQALNSMPKPDFVFFDGNHTKEATLNYFEFCLPHITNNTMFVFDDIHLSEGMEEAWETIKQNDKVKVTLDLYHFGIVFFKQEFTKQDFMVRF